MAAGVRGGASSRLFSSPEPRNALYPGVDWGKRWCEQAMLADFSGSGSGSGVISIAVGLAEAGKQDRAVLSAVNLG